MLTTEGLRIGQCAENITDFLIENCPKLAPMKLLSNIIEAQQSQGTEHALKHIRAVGFEEEYYTADALDMLAKLADGTYEGLSAEGISGEDEIPVLEGKITVHSKYYQDSVDLLKKIFNRLNLIVDGIACVRIADPEVLRILIDRLDVDGIGAISEKYVIENQIEVTSLWFYNNTVIETFDEFERMNVLFKDNNYDGVNLFRNCTSLRSIQLPYTVSFIPVSCFQGCTNLTNIILQRGITEIRTNAFRKCSSLKKLIIPDTVIRLGGAAFIDSGIEVIDLPASVTSIGSSVFNALPTLKTMIIRGEVVKADGTGDGSMFKCWENCTGLESFVMLSETPMGFGFWMLNGTTCKIYVPDNSVDTYKAASGWSGLVNRILPLSSYSGEL